MNRILNALFWKKKDTLRIIAAAIGTGIGVFVLIISIQFSAEIKQIFTQSGGKGEALYLIISKNVSLRNSLQQEPAAFNDREVNNLLRQEFILDSAFVLSNKFPLAAAIQVPGGTLQTELFFEAVPDHFLDKVPDGWDWQVGDPTVPIIIYRDFLALYNFGYSSSVGVPQLTEGSLGLVPVNLYLNRSFHDPPMKALITGFTDRYPSILVPYSFLLWANETYSTQSGAISRIAIKVDPKAENQIRNFLKQHNYHTNEDSLNIGSIASALFVGSLIVMIFGMAIACMSLLLLAVTIQSVISQNQSEIILLMQLGYNRKQIVRELLPGVLIIILPFIVLFGSAAFISITQLQKMIGKYVITVSQSIALPNIFFALVTTAAIPLLIIWLIFGALRKTEK